MKIQDQAKSIAKKLSNLARSKNIPYQNIATEFLIERFLVRVVADKKLYSALIFKGGYVGLRVYDSPRYTIDLDALLQRIEIPIALELIQRAAALDLGDAVWFRFESEINLETQGEYGGIRLVFRTGIGEVPAETKRAQVIHFDLGIGDPVTPAPIAHESRELLGEKSISWKIYPIETIIAEKIHALVDRGSNNSRSKDIFDLMQFVPRANPKALQLALTACFKHRKTELPLSISQDLRPIELTLLNMGWPSAISGIKDAPTCEEAFSAIIAQLEKMGI